jgi:phage minor structural protein
MIKIFGQNDTVFTSNGDKILQPTKARLRKEDGGDYYVDIECSTDYSPWIKHGNILVCPTPTGEQAFRINNPEQNKTKIKARAKHIFFDSQNYLIVSAMATAKTCEEALEIINASTEPQTAFTVASDINDINSYGCNLKSLYEAVSGVLARWGGHLVRNNFDIQIKETIGTDKGVTIRYGKNLKEIQKSEDWNNVVTKLLPTGKDGIQLDSVYLISDTQYDVPYTKTVSFNQDLEKEEGETEAQYENRLKQDLEEQATAYLAENCKPKINYTVKASIENISDIGDIIEVIDEDLGIDLITSVTAIEYDCNLEKITLVEFGNIKEKLSNLLNIIKKQS